MQPRGDQMSSMPSASSGRAGASVGNSCACQLHTHLSPATSKSSLRYHNAEQYITFVWLQVVAERDGLAARLAEMEGPGGPATHAAQLEQLLAQEQQRCGLLSQQVAAATAECEQLRQEVQDLEDRNFNLDGQVGLLRNELVRLQSAV